MATYFPERKTLTRMNGQFRLVYDDEEIGEGAFKSFNDGPLRPIKCKEVAKLTPKDFPEEWKFYKRVPVDKVNQLYR